MEKLNHLLNIETLNNEVLLPASIWLYQQIAKLTDGQLNAAVDLTSNNPAVKRALDLASKFIDPAPVSPGQLIINATIAGFAVGTVGAGLTYLFNNPTGDSDLFPRELTGQSLKNRVLTNFVIGFVLGAASTVGVTVYSNSQ